MAIGTLPAPRRPPEGSAAAIPDAPPEPPPKAQPFPPLGPPWLASWLAPISVGGALLLLWEVTARLALVPAFVLPAPEAVAGTLWALLADGEIPRYAGWTLIESLTGFALGAAIALPAGYAVARGRWTARAIQPYLAASQALPAVALAPLLLVWLGAGLAATTVLCALIVFFPAYITTTLGLRALDRDVLDAARVDGASGWTLFASVEWPLALPAVLAGLRTSLTLSITGAVVGDFVAGGNGLGYLLEFEAGQLDTRAIFAILIVLALLAAALYGLARLAERRFSHLEGN
jgi:NitT/TauT family transport system permease protein